MSCGGVENFSDRTGESILNSLKVYLGDFYVQEKRIAVV